MVCGDGRGCFLSLSKVHWAPKLQAHISIFDFHNFYFCIYLNLSVEMN